MKFIVKVYASPDVVSLGWHISIVVKYYVFLLRAVI